MFVNLRVGAVNRKSVVFVNFPPIVHPHMVRVDKSFTAGRPLSPPRYNVPAAGSPPSDPAESKTASLGGAAAAPQCLRGDVPL